MNMQKIVRTCVIALCLGATAIPAAAVPMSSVRPQQAFYLNGIGENELVMVVSVNQPGGMVEIIRSDGSTDWVSPDRLMTADQSVVSDGVEILFWVALAYCAVSGECSN